MVSDEQLRYSGLSHKEIELIRIIAFFQQKENWFVSNQFHSLVMHENGWDSKIYIKMSDLRYYINNFVLSVFLMVWILQPFESISLILRCFFFINLVLWPIKIISLILSLVNH